MSVRGFDRPPHLFKKKTQWFVFLLLSFKSSMCTSDHSPLLDAPLRIRFLSPVCGLSPPPDSIFHKAEVFSFDKVQLIHYFFPGSCLLCCKGLVLYLNIIGSLWSMVAYPVPSHTGGPTTTRTWGLLFPPSICSVSLFYSPKWTPDFSSHFCDCLHIFS